MGEEEVDTNKVDDDDDNDDGNTLRLRGAATKALALVGPRAIAARRVRRTRGAIFILRGGRLKYWAAITI